MYGLPGQSLDAWLKTLETALSFAPEHLSCYQLTLAARNPHGPDGWPQGSSAPWMKKPSGNFSS